METHAAQPINAVLAFGRRGKNAVRFRISYRCARMYRLRGSWATILPVETLEAKKKLLPQAARENWLCLFYHDPDEPLCRIVEEGRKLTASHSHEREERL